MEVSVGDMEVMCVCVLVILIENLVIVMRGKYDSFRTKTATNQLLLPRRNVIEANELK